MLEEQNNKHYTEKHRMILPDAFWQIYTVLSPMNFRLGRRVTEKGIKNMYTLMVLSIKVETFSPIHLICFQPKQRH